MVGSPHFARRPLLSYHGAGGKGKLDVASSLDAQSTNDPDAGRPKHLILFVREGLTGGNYNAVSGVHSHGVDVFHVAYDDAIICGITHHFIFEFLPTQKAFLDQHLMAGAGCQTSSHNASQVLEIVSNASPAATQCVGRGVYH